MSASLPGIGKLSAWWRPALDDAIASRRSRGPIWNLLPNEHDAAWSGGSSRGRPVVRVRFTEPDRRGRMVTVSHRNKALKGELVRFLLDHPGAGAHDLADWTTTDGFRLASVDDDPSSGETLVEMQHPA